MSDRHTDDDPFRIGDADASAREQRRRAREQRRSSGGGDEAAGAAPLEPQLSEGSHEDHDEGADLDHEIYDDAHDGEPAYDEPAHEEPAHEEPAHEEPAHEEPAHEEPAYAEGGYAESDDYDDGGWVETGDYEAVGHDDGGEPPHRAGRAGFAGGWSSGGPSTQMRRRILTGVGIGGVFLVLLLGLSQLGGEDPPPQPVAVEPIKTISVSVPEGLTLEGMADVAKDAKLKGSYEKAAEKALGRFDLAAYGAEDASSLEGFLFPATYELEKGAPASDLVKKQLEAFEQMFAGVDLKASMKKNLTPYDLVTIASMIEREVSVEKERPLVSAVIYNRLAADEPLGIDATLRYDLDNFEDPLLESELAMDTPYNTRINAGLPPTPIGNPGLASLEAAAEPANEDFFYYVIEPGTCNEHVFTDDQAEFDAAVAAYQQAQADAGGSPTKCP